jgi:hypothetical protein
VLIIVFCFCCVTHKNVCSRPRPGCTFLSSQVDVDCACVHLLVIRLSVVVCVCRYIMLTDELVVFVLLSSLLSYGHTKAYRKVLQPILAIGPR